MSDRRRGSRRAVLAVLGVVWVAVPTLVACRGVLGIHDLTYDAGPGKEDGPSRKADASDDTGSDDGGGNDTGSEDTSSEDTGAGDSGVDATLKDAGHDVGVDAGHDVGVDAGHDVGVDAGQDAGHDAGDAESDADKCVTTCIANNGGTGSGSEVQALLTQFNPTACPCTSCGSACNTSTCKPLTGGQAPACQTCLVELMNAGAGVNACGMPLGGCQAADAGCMSLGGCLHTNCQ